MFTGLASPWHLLLLFFAILMFFGAKRLPEMGRGLGDGMREFKDSISGDAGASAGENTTVLEPKSVEAAPVPRDRDDI